MKVLLIIGLACLAGLARGEDSRSDDFALAELQLLVDKTWSYYLQEELRGRDPREDESFEWYALAALRANPGNGHAITNLISNYLVTDQFVLAVAAAEYANALGKRNFRPTIESFRLGYAEWLSSDESEVLNLGQLDVIQTARQRKNTIVTPEYYAAVIPRLRKLLKAHGATLPILMELAHAYNELDEPQMVCMLTALILRTHPLHETALPMHVASLERLQQRKVSAHTIRNYLKMKHLDPSYFPKFSRWCQSLKLRYEGKQFLESWTESEPLNPEAWEMLGQILLTERDYQNALVAFTRSVKSPDHRPTVYLRLAELASLEADMPGMEAWLTKYRAHITDEELEEILQQHRFKRYPNLPKRLAERKARNP